MSNKCLKVIAIIWSLAAIAAITFLPGRPSPGLNPVAELTHRAGAGEAVPEQGPSSPPMSGRWVDVTMNVSAYCSCAKCCGTCSPGITASGATVDAVSHLVAAPPEYPFGTVMIVPGYGSGPVCVLDRGGAIKGNKLDVYFPTHQAALNWGRRELTVKIWEQTDGR